MNNNGRTILYCEKCQIHYIVFNGNFDNIKCEVCENELIVSNISYEEYITLPKSKFCPQCDNKYPKRFIKCPKCHVTLIKTSTKAKKDAKLFKPSPSSQPKPTYTPKCPTCGSLNVSKISAGKKTIGFALLGLFSSNLGKTMECDNCGYKW